MGLDQYAWTKKTEADRDAHEWSISWRKHSRLQEFMQSIWVARGNSQDEFNCADMQLTKNDIALLSFAVRSGFEDYVCEGGFFWGHQFQEEAAKDSYKDDLEFVEAASDAIDKGLEVYYSCWY